MNRLVWWLRQHGAIGKAHAVPRRKVAEVLDLSVRDVKKLAEAARLAGEAVLWSTDAKRGGLYLAADENEILEHEAKMRRLALSILRERSALKRMLRRKRESRVQAVLGI